METGDFIEINYVGRIKQTGEIFDLTDESVAAEEGIPENNVLPTVKVVVGAKQIVPGLDDALREMSVGEKRTVEVSAENGFGNRSSDNIKKYSKRVFNEQGVNAAKGDFVDIDGRKGKVLFASSGRVMVDFNHPLAGKDLVYDVEIVKQIDDEEQKIERLCADIGVPAEVAVDGEECTVATPVEDEQLQDRLVERITTHSTCVDVSFEHREDVG